MAEDLGSLVDQMIKLAVKNPKVLDPKYKGKDAVTYDSLVKQLNQLQQDHYFLRARVERLTSDVQNIANKNMPTKPRDSNYKKNPFFSGIIWNQPRPKGLY